MNDRLDEYRLLMADVYELAGSSRRSSDRIAGELGQTAARWHVLSAVSERPQNVPAIARRLGLVRQAVQRVVNDLADEGMVVLEANPAHARSPLVRLTGGGRHVLDELFQRSDPSRTELLDRAGIRARDLAEARRVVRGLAAAMQSERGRVDGPT